MKIAEKTRMYGKPKNFTTWDVGQVDENFCKGQ
jgi:hypothetical protein